MIFLTGLSVISHSELSVVSLVCLIPVFLTFGISVLHGHLEKSLKHR